MRNVAMFIILDGIFPSFLPKEEISSDLHYALCFYFLFQSFVLLDSLAKSFLSKEANSKRKSKEGQKQQQQKKVNHNCITLKNILKKP